MKVAIGGGFVTVAIAGAIGWGLVNQEGKPDPAPPANVIILPDGVPFAAQPGSPDRALIDWLSVREPGECRLTLGPLQFRRGSAEPTEAFRQRIERLARILRSFDNIGIDLWVEHGAGEGRDDGLSDRRSAWLLAAMRGAGNAPPRLIGDQGKNLPVGTYCPSPRWHGHAGFVLAIRRMGTG